MSKNTKTLNNEETSKKVTTGDGRAPAAEEDYRGEKVAKQLAQIAPEFGHLFDADPRDMRARGKQFLKKDVDEDEETELDKVEDEEEDEEDEDTDEEVVLTPKTKGASHAKKNKVKHKTSEAEEEVSEEGEEGDGNESGEDDETVLENEEDDEDEDEDEDDRLNADISSLRSQVIELQAALSLAQGQLPQIPQAQQQAQEQTGSQQAFRPGFPVKLKKPTEEELANITSSPDTFVKYMEDTLASVLQQSVVNLQPMVHNAVRLQAVTEEFFNAPENKDISRGVLREYILSTAAKLDESGQFTGIIPTLTRAAELVRAHLKLKAPTNKKVVVGRKGVEVAQHDMKNMAKRFPAGTGRRQETKKKGANKKDEITSSLADMLRVGGSS